MNVTATSQADLTVNGAVTAAILIVAFLTFYGLAELQHAIRIHWRFACARDRALHPQPAKLEVVVSHAAVLALLPTSVRDDFAKAGR